MFDSDAALAKRYGASRPGLQLIAVADAALPVTQLKVDVLAQERKPLPLLDEFTIRLAAMGVNDPEQMARILGLELKLTETSIVEQLATDNLIRIPGRKTLVELTPQGRVMAVELESTRPIQRPLPVTFDRMTWEISSYRPEFLIQRNEAETGGLIILEPAHRRHVLPSDVTVASLNRLISDDPQREGKLDVLVVEGVSPKKHRYLPVKLLIFADENRTEVQIGVVVEGQVSSNHEHALLKAGGPSSLGITVAEPAARPQLPDGLDATKDSQSAQESPPPAAAVGRAPSDAANLVSKPEIRDISVHEHPEFLQNALVESRQRLLIISPWVKKSVVDTAFIGSLERLIRRKVQIYIAYGIGHDDSQSDELALSRLRNLAGRFSEQFTFVRLKNSHAKILISDGNWISTSFNWLSFRGDPSRTYRMEEGILIRGQKYVDDAYDKYLHMIDDQKVVL